jgi:hypothetical protein
MQDRRVDRQTQRRLTFDRHEVWHSLPAGVQRQCADLVSQLLRAVLKAAAAPRSPDEREDSTRSS